MEGWQGVSLVTVTYVYFLIFAQFGFLNRLASLRVGSAVDEAAFKAVMASMAAGGILLSLLAPRVSLGNPAQRLRAGLAGCASAAFLSLAHLGIAEAVAVSFLIGASLGLLTVTLATHLRRWTGNRDTLLKVGLGTGIGYLLCNVPAVFTASPLQQALFAGLLCFAVLFVPLSRTAAQPTEEVQASEKIQATEKIQAKEEVQAAEKLDKSGFVTGHDFSRADEADKWNRALAPAKAHPRSSLEFGPLSAALAAEEESGFSQPASIQFAVVLASFVALVWLDSAAFFIIQQTPALKAGAWEGAMRLWAIGSVHLLAALTGAWLLQKRKLTFVLATAFLLLCCACLLLDNSGSAPQLAGMASLFYPAGVSLYSVALVAYPSLLSPASSEAERGRQAGWIYALAGWAASAMGIGMGQNLGHVPVGFLVAAGAVILVPTRLGMRMLQRREFALPAMLLVVAYCASRFLVADTAPVQLSQVERGRQVYISEGCINCHSQYVRPGSPDELMWGPAMSVEEVHRQRPPLIGNRRQGPDLSQVGSRRSPLWLKAHFFDPPDVSGASIMPSYGFLFRDGRGDDLVAYLGSLRSPENQQLLQVEAAWAPSSAARAAANLRDGKQLFDLYCRTCHDAGGNTRWQGQFKRLPPDLTVGPYLHIESSWTAPERLDHLAQIVKFGIPGTDMPGHEYLGDQEVASLSLWLSHTIAQPSPTQSSHPL
jgi:cytochrome c oxidase cbb3-type subunit 2